jgi:hypothetical protein
VTTAASMVARPRGTGRAGRGSTVHLDTCTEISRRAPLTAWHGYSSSAGMPLERWARTHCGSRTPRAGTQSACDRVGVWVRCEHQDDCRTARLSSPKLPVMGSPSSRVTKPVSTSGRQPGWFWSLLLPRHGHSVDWREVLAAKLGLPLRSARLAPQATTRRHPVGVIGSRALTTP